MRPVVIIRLLVTRFCPPPLASLALQYQTFVPHDQAGLVSIFPSVQSYVDALTTLQAKQTEWIIGNALPNPYYWAGNEPDLLAPWQFAAAGNQFASLTQYWTRFILAKYYTTQPDGIPGNDDFGRFARRLRRMCCCAAR